MTPLCSWVTLTTDQAILPYADREGIFSLKLKDQSEPKRSVNSLNTALPQILRQNYFTCQTLILLCVCPSISPHHDVTFRKNKIFALWKPRNNMTLKSKSLNMIQRKNESFIKSKNSKILYQKYLIRKKFNLVQIWIINIFNNYN